jgi:hypothetical protein
MEILKTDRRNPSNCRKMHSKVHVCMPAIAHYSGGGEAVDIFQELLYMHALSSSPHRPLVLLCGEAVPDNYPVVRWKTGFWSSSTIGRWIMLSFKQR